MRKGILLILLVCCAVLRVSAQQMADEVRQVFALHQSANAEAERGNYSRAIELIQRAVDISRPFDKDKDLQWFERTLKHVDGQSVVHDYYQSLYAISLGNLARYYDMNGYYRKGLELALQSLALTKERVGEKGTQYAMILEIVASCYSDLGNYPEAIRLTTECLDLRRELEGEDNAAYISTMNNLASYYYRSGNMREAISLGTEILERDDLYFRADAGLYNINLASYYSEIGMYDEAKYHDKEAVDLLCSLYPTTPTYGTALANLALDYINLEDYEEALPYAEEALAVRKETVGENHPDYSASLSIMAALESVMGHHDKAKELITQCKDIVERFYGNRHPNYSLQLGTEASFYASEGKYREALDLLVEALDIDRHDLMTGFITMSATQRAQSWMKYRRQYESMLPRYVFLNGDASKVGLLYDQTALFAKGLLLNTDMEVERLLTQKGDTAALSTYAHIKQQKALLTDMLKQPKENRSLNVDSLEWNINQQERKLMERVGDLNELTEALNVTWQQVRDRLGKKDLAVEFIAFPLKPDSICYMALTLKKGYKQPKMKMLASESQLTSAEKTGSDALYRMVWGQLQEELRGVNRVFFAPAGVMHSMGIEFAENNEGIPFADSYEAYRLSSTRQLIARHTKKGKGETVLYGGLRYDTDVDAWAAECRQVKGVERDTLVTRMRSVVDSTLFRGGAAYLPATKVEVETIGHHLEEASVSCRTFTDLEGTEESFKALSSVPLSTLHVATHGFYWDTKKAEKAKGLSFLFDDDNFFRQRSEDEALSRCGLLFTGANLTLKNQPIPPDIDDGILTAQEIAGLDLRNLDMVVLSACQTALGEVKGSEGVFGLQRGFKKAGVNTLLMSLRPVDDMATQILMTHFFDRLLKGDNKVAALRSAQQVVRSYTDDKGNHPYTEPLYWASFVLLDGM